jgi:hypothetical protein
MLDKVLIAAVLLALAVYMYRVVRIANVYPGLDEGPDPAVGPRL